MAVAYAPNSAAVAATPARRTAPSFWSRLFDRVVEARMAQARRDLARHAHFPRFDPKSHVFAQMWHHHVGG